MWHTHSLTHSLTHSRTNCQPHLLPGETIFADYVTEYSTDRIEMHTGAIQAGQRVLLVDDLIATGGTLCTFPTLSALGGAVPLRWGRPEPLPASARTFRGQLGGQHWVPSGMAGGMQTDLMRGCLMKTLPVPALPAGAGAELVGKAGGEVIEAACVIELPELKGREKIKGLPLYVLVEKEGL